MRKIIYVCPKCKLEMVKIGAKDKGPLPCQIYRCSSCPQFYHLIETGSMLTLAEYIVMREKIKDDSNGGAS